MKKLISKTLVLCLLCSLTVSIAHAQKNDESNSEFKHIIKTNVLGYFAGQYQLAYEHAINNNFSAQLSAGFLTGSGSATGYETNRTGFILIPEVRYYFGGNAPERLYVGAFARYRHASNKLTDENFTNGGTGTNQDLSRKRKVNSVGGGMILGYQVIAGRGFTFDIFAGPQYKSRSQNTVYNTDALNEAATSSGYDNMGDELFSSKFIDFKIDDKAGMGLRFGFNFGYAF